MNPLIAVLAAWPGREATKSELEAKGYWLPQRYKEVVLANCSGFNECELERYWSEVALESFGAAGRVDSDRRVFRGETAYRSQYLDDLALSEVNRGMAEKGFSLEPAIQAFRTKMRTTNEDGKLFGSEVSSRLEGHKQTEIDYFQIHADAWTGKKIDISHALKNAAMQKDFVYKQKKWRKTFRDSIECAVYVDAGISRTWTFQLPLIFEIYHQVDPTFTFTTYNAEKIIQGFEYYRLYKTPEAAVLGVNAYVELFDTIGDITSG